MVEEGHSLPTCVSPNTVEGPRLSGVHELTPQIGWMLGEAEGFVRGSYGEPRVRLT